MSKLTQLTTMMEWRTENPRTLPLVEDGESAVDGKFEDAAELDRRQSAPIWTGDNQHLVDLAEAGDEGGRSESSYSLRRRRWRQQGLFFDVIGFLH